jgi:hypothetical protein
LPALSVSPVPSSLEKGGLIGSEKKQVRDSVIIVMDFRVYEQLAFFFFFLIFNFEFLVHRGGNWMTVCWDM